MFPSLFFMIRVIGLVVFGFCLIYHVIDKVLNCGSGYVAVLDIADKCG